VVSVTDPYGRILGFLDRSLYIFFPVAPQLYSRGWPFKTHNFSENLVAPGIEPGRIEGATCQRDGSLRPYSRFSRPKSVHFLSSSSSIVLTRLTVWDPLLLIKSGSAGNRIRADRGCHVASVMDPNGRIHGFPDRSRYFLFQVAPQLHSRGWLDPVREMNFKMMSCVFSFLLLVLWLCCHDWDASVFWTFPASPAMITNACLAVKSLYSLTHEGNTFFRISAIMNVRFVH
jgi:hypothetical protein